MIISRAPFRITFLGGGSDIPDHFENHGGYCLNTAINYHGYVTVQHFHSQLFDHALRISYRKAERPKEVGEIENPLIRACLKYVGIEKDVELHHMADLPARTGLGSSSTLAVSLLNALYAYQGVFKTTSELANEAIHLEREILNEAGGYQDQIAAAYGGTSLIQFYRDGSYAVNRLPLTQKRLDSINQSILLIYTRKQRNSFEVLRENQQKRKDMFGLVNQLADYAQEGAELLCSDKPLEAFGAMLDEGWKLKKEISSASLPVIDQIYDTAKSSGAWGGKLMGAGKGGFLMLMAPLEKHAAIRKAIGSDDVLNCRIDQPGTQIVFSNGF